MNRTQQTLQTNKRRENNMTRTLATTNQQKPRQYYDQDTSNSTN